MDSKQCSVEAPPSKKKRAKNDQDDGNANDAEGKHPLIAGIEQNGHPQDSTVSKSTTGRSSFWERRKVWNIHELLAETEHIQPKAAQNIVELFENENTIPFICR